MKSALITGITGQDGSYLAELLIEKGYHVHGVRRRASTPNTSRLNALLSNPKFNLHYGDLTDSASLFQIMQKIRPDEIYHLAAQSDVAISFENPLYTSDVNGLGTLRLLETVRLLDLESRFYQASTSELYGLVQEVPQKESTPFYPRSPYAVSKLFAYWSVKNYREAYGLFACNGILFNHESPKRGEHFVTRKITRKLARIFHGLEKRLLLGNLNAKRDWGHTRDFVEMQWLILQQDKPDDYVIATGKQHSVREFVELACLELGVKIAWEGSGLQERGIAISVDQKCAIEEGSVIVGVDPQYFRPSEVETLLGDPEKAKRKLSWEPKISLRQLVSEMIEEDLKKACQERCLSTSVLMPGC